MFLFFRFENKRLYVHPEVERESPDLITSPRDEYLKLYFARNQPKIPLLERDRQIDFKTKMSQEEFERASRFNDMKKNVVKDNQLLTQRNKYQQFLSETKDRLEDLQSKVHQSKR